MDLVKVNVRLSAEKLERLKDRAAKLGCSYNYLIRRAIDAYLAAKEERNGKKAE